MEGKSDKELALEGDPPPPPPGPAVHPTAGPTLDSYVSVSESTEGYDLQFQPRLEQKYECPICLMCLREPVQTECGHRFCRACILRSLRDAGNRCPVDQLPLQKMFPDLCVRREIMDLMAHCPHGDCPDVIELRNMEAHQEMCPYGLQPCPNRCGETLRRKQLDDHVRNACPKRPMHCDHCKVLIAVDHKQVHLDACPKVTITCDSCGEYMIRERLMVHFKTLCPKMVVMCRYHTIGCPQQMERELLPGHLASSVEQHMELMMARLEQVNIGSTRQEHESPLDARVFDEHDYFTADAASTKPGGSTLGEDSSFIPEINFPSSPSPDTYREPKHNPPSYDNGQILAKLGSEIGDFHSTADGLHVPPPPMLKSSLSTPYSQERQRQPAVHRHASADYHYPNADAGWYACGDRGSVRHQEQRLSEADAPPSSIASMQSPPETNDLLRIIQRMGGEMDSLKEKMKVQEQRAALQKQEMIELHLSSERKIKELAESASSLKTQLCDGEFYWRLDGYGELLQEAERGETSVRHSCGFYTACYGYKLCLRVNFNSSSSRHGQHISLFVHFMRGEFDDLLSWPFNGTITLSILDQNADTTKRKPISETLIAKPELAAFLRPRTNRNHKGFGYMEFAPLEMLTSGAYIKDDCIIIKVKVH